MNGNQHEKYNKLQSKVAQHRTTQLHPFPTILLYKGGSEVPSKGRKSSDKLAVTTCTYIWMLMFQVPIPHISLSIAIIIHLLDECIESKSTSTDRHKHIYAIHVYPCLRSPGTIRLMEWITSYALKASHHLYSCFSHILYCTSGADLPRLAAAWFIAISVLVRHGRGISQ